MTIHNSEIREYIINNLDNNGLFNKTYTTISNEIGLNQNLVRLTLLDLVKEEFVTVINYPNRGRASNPLYKLNTHKFEMIEITTNNDNDTKTIDFEGVEITLITTDELAGYCISKSDLVMATLENKDTFNKIIASNAELFKGHIALINGRDYVDKFGTLSFLVKLNLDRVHPIKRDVLALFQQNIITIMCDSKLKAKLVISENHRISIRNNLNCLLEIDMEQVELMLSDLETQFSLTLDNCYTKSIQSSVKANKLEKEVSQLRNKLELEKNSKLLMASQINELNSKLLERN